MNHLLPSRWCSRKEFACHCRRHRRCRLDPWVRKKGEEMATHSWIFTWKIPWTEEPGELQSTGSQRVRHDWAPTHDYHALPSRVLPSVLWDRKGRWYDLILLLRNCNLVRLTTYSLIQSSCGGEDRRQSGVPSSLFLDCTTWLPGRMDLNLEEEQTPNIPVSLKHRETQQANCTSALHGDHLNLLGQGCKEPFGALYFPGAQKPTESAAS